MEGFPLILADASRADQILRIGRSPKLFGGYTFHLDEDGIAWAVSFAAGKVYAVTWLGPGWVFDPAAQQRRADDLRVRRASMTGQNQEGHREELAKVIGKLRLGPIAERLLWLIHQQVLRVRSSLLHIPDSVLKDAIWGIGKRPAHWRQDLLAILQGLTWLHLTEGPGNETPVLGTETAVLTHVADLRGTANDCCLGGCEVPPDCPHHHYLINVGRGFLGILEDFVHDEDENGVRSYVFPISGGPKQSSSLRKVGKSGQLVTIYLPAKLGDRKVCSDLSMSQHRLLQAIVRETTRNTKDDRLNVSEAEVIEGNAIITIDGKSTLMCVLLDQMRKYVGFNGNKLLKGRGYLMLSEGGWMAKAGYSLNEFSMFVGDLTVLSAKLGLIPVGIDPRDSTCISLQQLSVFKGSIDGRASLRRLHLRIYTSADYLVRWNQLFGWQEVITVPAIVSDPKYVIASAIEQKVVSQKQLAEGINVDLSLLNKALRGKRPWPKGWLDRAAIWLSSRAKNIDKAIEQ